MIERNSMDGQTVRPAIRGRDSSGQHISLLNEEPSKQDVTRNHYESRETFPTATEKTASSRPQISTASYTSSPATPGLLRSNSYDSSNTNDSVSPITPISQEFGRHTQYPGFGHEKDPSHSPYYQADLYQRHMGQDYPQDQTANFTHHSYLERRHLSYPENNYAEESHRAERDGPRRYACRYKDEFNCNKTFTTSGHASRHAKIHTSEKSIDCTFPNCQKKFTRQDNMKQHLETHSKERSRSSAKPSISKSGLTQPASVKKSGSGSQSSPSSQGGSSIMRPRSRSKLAGLALDPALMQSSSNGYSQVGPSSARPSTVSPGFSSGYSQAGPSLAGSSTSSLALSSYGAFGEGQGMQHSLLSHQLPGQVDHSGLDTLVAAVEIESEIQKSPESTGEAPAGHYQKEGGNGSQQE